MGKVVVLKDTNIVINLPADFADNGWTISNNIATHTPCNPGYITNNGNAVVEIGKTYTLTYEVLNYISGSVNVILGTTDGISHNANGIYTENILVAGNTSFRFYSDGALSIKLVTIFPADAILNNAVTLAFSEHAKKWVTYYSWQPEMMLRFIDSFFTFSGGELWEHDVNEVYNNFYGVQYPSKVTFYVNINPSTIKQFFSIRVQSNKAWGSPNKGDIAIEPAEGKLLGQNSRLKSGNYRNLQGDWFADFLRNMDDPRFNDELVALMEGSELQGKVMAITLENNDVTEVRLMAVDVKTAPHDYTY